MISRYMVDADAKVIVVFDIYSVEDMKGFYPWLKSVAGRDWREWHVHFGPIPVPEKPAGIDTGLGAHMVSGGSSNSEEDQQRHLRRPVGFKKSRPSKKTLLRKPYDPPP